jgi:hypothetical protein
MVIKQVEEKLTSVLWHENFVLQNWMYDAWENKTNY